MGLCGVSLLLYQQFHPSHVNVSQEESAVEMLYGLAESW